MNKNIKTKIKDNTRSKDSELSQYSIAYSAKNMDNSQVSYEIISTLKGTDNIIAEVDSSFLNLTEKYGKELATKLITGFSEIGVEYKNKSKTITSKKSIFSISAQGKKIEGFEIIAFLPHEAWCDSRLREILPDIGVKYYILKSDCQISLAEFFSLEPDKRSELCKLEIFDYTSLNSMGINTSVYNKEDIIELLNS